jgi:precorrin-2 dehydrogenase / sirohydrochlorin ferrochelatase
MPVDGPQYPVNLILQGRRCLVIGGGAVAARKIEGLLAAQAIVHVIAIEVIAEIRAMNVTIQERAFEPGDLAGYALVITATGDRLINSAILAEANSSNVWLNAADEPESCSFTLPAVVRRGPLMVTLSTAGHSPALATWLKRHVQNELGVEYEIALNLLSEQRKQIKSAGGSTEDVDWQKVFESDFLTLIRNGDVDTARQLLASLTN